MDPIFKRGCGASMGSMILNDWMIAQRQVEVNFRIASNKYVGTGPENISRERTPLKKWLISNLGRKGIYFKGTIFQQSTKPLITSQNRLNMSRKNFSLFPNMLLLA
jgi:hypothetical protein